jgi:PKHD-type hydroxylase
MVFLQPLVHTRFNVFTEEECQRIIGLGLSSSLEVGLSPGLKVDINRRMSMVRFLYSAEDNYWIFSRLWDTVKLIPHGEHITTLNFVQFTEYDAEYGGHFGLHKDTEHFYHATNVTNLKRKVTCVIQLSDGHLYEGGDLVLYPTKKQEPITGHRDRGCAIMFPSNMVHEAKKVTSGVRYSLVAWFEGPK